MKTKNVLLVGIILGIILFLFSCKQAAGGDYYAPGCELYRLNFVSTTEVQYTIVGSGAGTWEADYLQTGDQVKFTIWTGTVYTFKFNSEGCLAGQGYNSTCIYCEQ